jgi:hypothetical protein
MIFVVGIDDSARVAANGRRRSDKSGVKGVLWFEQGVRLIFWLLGVLAHQSLASLRGCDSPAFQPGKSGLKNKGPESYLLSEPNFLSAPGVPETEIRARRL